MCGRPIRSSDDGPTSDADDDARGLLHPGHATCTFAEFKTKYPDALASRPHGRIGAGVPAGTSYVDADRVLRGRTSNIVETSSARRLDAGTPSPGVTNATTRDGPRGGHRAVVDPGPGGARSPRCPVGGRDRRYLVPTRSPHGCAAPAQPSEKPGPRAGFLLAPSAANGFADLAVEGRGRGGLWRRLRDEGGAAGHLLGRTTCNCS